MKQACKCYEFHFSSALRAIAVSPAFHFMIGHSLYQHI